MTKPPGLAVPVAFIFSATLITLLLPLGILADCAESGFYLHTRSEFKEQDPESKQWWLRYKVKANNLLLLSLPSTLVETKLGKEIELDRLAWYGMRELKFGSESCSLSSIEQNGVLVSFSDLSDTRDIEIPRCSLKGTYAKEGYLLFDQEKRTLELPRSLELGKKPVTNEVRGAVQKALESQLKEQSLFLEKIGFSEFSAMPPIQSKNLKSVDFESTHFSETVKDFQIVIATLTLTDLSELMTVPSQPHDQSYFASIKNAIKGREATFPVVYFVSDGNPSYFGDAASCSLERLRSESQINSPPAIVPAGEIFVSAAFTFSGDSPRLVVFNETLAYDLKDPSNPIVVDYELGC